MSVELKAGEKIVVKENRLQVPDVPIIPFIEGDGIGPDIWRAAQHVMDHAVGKAFDGKRSICWKEILAGEKAKEKIGSYLPDETLQEIQEHVVAIKGPLTTPVGGGIRSLNVTIRQKLDLYACVRPVRWYRGVPSPVKAPEKLDVVIFRENTEDVYAGIEWESGSSQANDLIDFLTSKLGSNIRKPSGIGIKPVSPFGSKRLIRKAIRYALDQGRRSVTMVHKGNIMKYTEGAFRNWGYELAKEEFAESVILEDELWEKHHGKLPAGRVVLKDRIADSMFQQVLTRPDEYDVLATTNLNGDYLSDACAAQVGGLGMAPGANMSDFVACFEATHGTAPKYAGQDKVNPGSLILSGVMMLRYLGWGEAADLVEKGLEGAIGAKTVTYDLARLMEGAVTVKTSEFAKAIVAHM